MGKLGCEVHAFDPTTNYQPNLEKNVHFHLWGLTSADADGKVFGSDYYSGLQKGAEMLTFNQIRRRLGHENRNTCSVFFFRF